MAAEPLAAAERHAGYTVLATLFARELAPETAAELRAGTLRALMPTAAADPEAGAAIAALEAATPAAGEPLLPLAGVYGRLFLGAGGRRGVAPYASAYLSPRGRLFQEPAAAMADLLRRADRDVAIAGEAPDHVAVQFALMAELAASDDPAAAALGDELRTAWLAPWLGDLAHDLERLDSSGFYAAAARLARWLVDRDGGLAAAA
jgi:TorA maturation chaperone TorD